jgi:AmmeMemoRadiSam system protein A/AmmeMemoRadiSam system protein B
MGPSHYADLSVGSMPRAKIYRTPLGDVSVSAEKVEHLALSGSFSIDPPCRVQRPDWGRAHSLPAMVTAETWEHSVEVEVPFLQRTLDPFGLVPIIFGETDPADAARVLASLLDEKTLIVASSDLSHFHPYAEACQIDQECVDAICRLDLTVMEQQEACGKIPILVLMHLAKTMGWKVRLLDYRNSGDTSGQKAQVVGYAAIAFYAPFGRCLQAVERQSLLGIARAALHEAVTGRRLLRGCELTTNLIKPRGCFVTLTQNGDLRGCIGNLTPQHPLHQAVAENARSAALHDPRFPPVSSAEVGGLHIEVSVLSEPQPLSFSSPEDLLLKLQVGDGVILQMGRHAATYLPQVWEQLPDKVAFLNSLSQKAGCHASDWRNSGTRVSLYEVEAFEEQV